MAKNEDLTRAFGTTDQSEICLQVLSKAVYKTWITLDQINPLLAATISLTFGHLVIVS